MCQAGVANPRLVPVGKLTPIASPVSETGCYLKGLLQWEGFEFEIRRMRTGQLYG